MRFAEVCAGVGGTTLGGAVRPGMWPTARTGDAKQGPSSARKRAETGSGDVMLDDAVGAGGRLNPDFVEPLQGLPIGWTDLDCDEPRAAGWPAGQWPTPNCMDVIEGERSAGAKERQLRRGASDGSRRSSSGNLREEVLRWPSPPGDYQHPWEPPRVTDRKDQRTARLRCLGNACLPAVAEVVGRMLLPRAGWKGSR